MSLGVVVVGCSSTPDPSTKQEPTLAKAAAQDVDACGPNGVVLANDDPNARCAIREEYNVADLALGDEPLKSRDDQAVEGDTPAGDVGVDLPTPGTAQGINPLNLAGNAVRSCNGKAGAGFTTCGPQGNDSCCRANTITPGRAGTATVQAAFDMGVYEVTSGRFQNFVNTFNGNLRGAAQAGQIPGLSPDQIARLPASVGDVEYMLGPGCQARSDIANYGARTYPEAEISSTVNRFITDDNERAADIRADATPERLSAKPINCVIHQLAVAFCAWDGGRLPSNDEWRYVALGGGQGAVRTYPWGAGRTKNRLVTDLTGTNSNAFTYPEDFPFFDNGFNAYHIAPPGRKPDGASVFGIQDMGGNVLEWMADILGPDAGIVRGGSWEGHRDDNEFAYTNYPLSRSYGSVGFRCAYGATQPVAPPPVQPPVDAQKVNIYRAYNPQLGDHLQGPTPNEGAPAWGLEGISFQTLSAQVAGTVPFYRCRIGATGRHFLSNAANCEGQVVEGGIGFVYAAQAAGTLPLYRCLSPNGADHLTTLAPQECTNAGFRVEGRQGFAFPVQQAAPPPPPPPPPPPAACGLLGVNQQLTTNQSLTSCDNRFVLVMQGDGNLVLYQRVGNGVQALWHTGTFNTTSNRAVMQGDGNFVVYNTANQATFHTHTFNNPGAYLALQNDGNLVVYSPGGRPLWNSGTFGH